jgi:hypothetical protein
MSRHLDHPIAYDEPLIASRIAQRERKATRVAFAFVIALLLLVPIWLAFLLFL